MSEEEKQPGEAGSGIEPWPESRRGRILAIAAAWEVKPPYIYQLEKRGMPLDSLEAATAWQVANCRYGIGYRRKGGQGSAKPSSEGAGGEEEPEDLRLNASPRKRVRFRLDTIEASLEAAIRMEEEAASAVQHCLSQKQGGNSANLITAMNAFNKAQANRMEREEAVLKILERQKQLISIEAAVEIMTRAWTPLLQRLRSAPRRAAIKANPVDDALAETVFSEEIEDAIAEGTKSYEDVLAEVC